MLVKCDAGQLEWRTLVELSRDEIALQEILNKEDTHSKNQGLFGLPTRLIAKVYLFRTIYRGSGWAFANDPEFMHVSSSPKFWDDIGEKFYGKYAGIDKQHQQWKDLVIAGTDISIPSGRSWNISMGRDSRTGELKIPWTVLTNYPNQGLGADVMMLVRLSLWRRIRASGRKVKFISTVHDDIKFDCREADVQFVVDTCYQVFADLIPNIKRSWGYDWVVPMTCEVFKGMNMLDMEEVKPSNDLTYLKVS